MHIEASISIGQVLQTVITSTFVNFALTLNHSYQNTVRADSDLPNVRLTVNKTPSPMYFLTLEMFLSG